MSEQKAGEPGKEQTPLELANSWLSFRTSEVQKMIAKTEASREWEENYEMKAPGPRPSNIESGSLDATDWAIFEAEYRQFPEDKEESLEYLEGELERLQDELGIIEDCKQNVKDGDMKLIAGLAGYERERRKALEKQKLENEKMDKIIAEKNAGKEMDGISDTESVLRRLFDLVESGKVQENKSGNNGWELERKWNNGLHDYGKNHFQTEVRLELKEGMGTNVNIKTYLRPILSYESREKGQVDVGEGMSFTLNNGKIYDWNKNDIERSYEWGYPDRHVKPSNRPFDQSDFDTARNVISELYSDLESLSSK